MLPAGLDVLLGEVAAIRGQCRIVGQLRADRLNVLLELHNGRLELTLISCLIGQLGPDDHLTDRVNDRLA